MLTKNAYAYLAAIMASGNSTNYVATIKDRTGAVQTVSAHTFSFFNSMNSIRTTNGNTSGVTLSTDESEPTLDDYRVLDTDMITAVSGGGGVVSIVIDGGIYEITTTFSVQNASSESVVIRSLYCFGRDSNLGTASLLDHTKLANPITIPAGETKVFTYTIRLDTGV